MILRKNWTDNLWSLSKSRGTWCVTGLGGKTAVRYYTHWTGLGKFTWRHEPELEQYGDEVWNTGVTSLNRFRGEISCVNRFRDGSRQWRYGVVFAWLDDNERSAYRHLDWCMPAPSAEGVESLAIDPAGPRRVYSCIRGTECNCEANGYAQKGWNTCGSWLQVTLWWSGEAEDWNHWLIWSNHVFISKRFVQGGSLPGRK